MRRIILFFLATWMSHMALSQSWSANGTSLYYNGGNVGIGISSPWSLLHLNQTSGYITIWHTSADPGNSTVYEYENGKNVYWGESTDAGSYLFRGRNLLVSNGKLGIGVLTPGQKLTIAGGLRIDDGMTFSGTTGDSQAWLSFGNSGTGEGIASCRTGTVNLYGIDFFTGSTRRLSITNSGAVGINTTNTNGYTLAVNGSAIFTSAWVKPYANWPDYVFKTGYHLPALDSVSNYIQTHHHLPDLPSADSVQAKGIDLGTTEATLLKKIEELTLYLIEQKKTNEEQNDLLEKQQDRIDQLEALIRKNNRN